MDNDIIERAKEYAPEPLNDYYAIPAFIASENKRRAYIAGATAQKAIDDTKWLKIKSLWEKQAQINHDDEANYKQGYHDAIEKACDWLKKNFEYYIDVGVWSYYTYEDKLVEDFRKAMEE